jgi:membrane fusion protein, multidrug efflux system
MQSLIARLATLAVNARLAPRDRKRERDANPPDRSVLNWQKGSSDMKQPLLLVGPLRLSSPALLLPLLAALAGCAGEAKVADDVVRPVKIAVVGEAVQGRTLTYSGVVRPRIESAVGFRVPGKIVERMVNVGDRVEIDQTIAVLDDTDLRLAEDSARANVAAARTRRDIASINLDRGKALLPSSTIAQSAYDTRRNEMDAAESALESAEAQLRQASNAVGYATLKADKAGIVTAVLAEPGQVVNAFNAGQAVITLAHSGETEIAVAVPEQDAGFLAVGQPAKITLWAGPRASFAGKIREIAGQADAASRTYAIRIAVGDAPAIMRLGMTATVALLIDDEAAAMVVPLGALTEADGNPVVFVVDPASKTVRKTDVTVEGTAEDGVRIANGLNVGDWVVTAGVQFLRDGMRVRLPGEQQSARAANPT